jgi:hypothetical protein
VVGCYNQSLSLAPTRSFLSLTMLPPEILDQVTSLNLQHRELVSLISHLSRPSEIDNQLVLDDIIAKIKAGFAEADRGLEVDTLQFTSFLTVDSRSHD